MRLPLTLRVAFYAVRYGIMALTLTLAAWVLLVPASQAERQALRAPVGEARPEGLTGMRIARAMVHFAPNRAAKLLARASDGELSEELAGMMLRQLAAGVPADPTAEPAVATAPGGARFIMVE